MDNALSNAEAAAKSDDQITTSSNTIHTVLERFRTITGQLTDASETLQEDSIAIGEEISTILVSLQFQDRVSQILDASCTNMEFLDDYIRCVADADNDSQMDLDRQSVMEAMKNAYTMIEQHSAHGPVSDAPPTTDAITYF